MTGDAGVRTGRIVVAGAGMGGLRTAEALREQGFVGELVLIGAEDLQPYDRPPLSKQFLAGDAPMSVLQLRHSVEARFHLGARARSLRSCSGRSCLEPRCP